MDYAHETYHTQKEYAKDVAYSHPYSRQFFNQLALGLWDVIGQMEWMNEERE